MNSLSYIVAPLMGFLLMGQSWATEKVWSYSMEEMYQMATYFRSIREGKELDGIDKYLKATEFKGYVASVLDNSENYNECTKKHPVNDIVGRTALVITSNPLDRSNIAALNVLLGLFFACDESNWNKDK